MKTHRQVTLKRVTNAAQRSMRELVSLGFCCECGRSQGGCEPDMRAGSCEHCGKAAVYGAEELVLMMA